MSRDIKHMLEQERMRAQPGIPDGHEARFLSKLGKKLPEKRRRIFTMQWSRAAAVGLLLISLGWGVYYSFSPESPTEKLLTLSDISPELKKVETYFISSINVRLANLKVSEKEKELVDAYLTKLKELGVEYQNLNLELNRIGVNDMTVTALIENLKIQLQLLKRLEKELDHSKQGSHENKSSENI